MRAHSSVDGFYSPSWTYMRLDFSSLDTDYVALHVGFHLITIQAHWNMHSCSKNKANTRQQRNNPTSFFLVK